MLRKMIVVVAAAVTLGGGVVFYSTEASARWGGVGQANRGKRQQDRCPLYYLDNPGTHGPAVVPFSSRNAPRRRLGDIEFRSAAI